MDTASLIATGYEKLNDTTPTAKALALQLVVQFDRSARAKEAILNVLKNWPNNCKEQAIVAFGMHQRQQLKQHLAPYATNDYLKRAIGRVLIRSRTPEDVTYGKQLLGEQD